MVIEILQILFEIKEFSSASTPDGMSSFRGLMGAWRNGKTSVQTAVASSLALHTLMRQSLQQF